MFSAMAWLSIFVMVALFQQFVIGQTILTHDSENNYYKIPMPWGINLFEGSVTVMCRSSALIPVCLWSENNVLNPDYCIETKKRNVNAMDEMARLLGCESLETCTPLFGVFIARKSFTEGEYGLVEENGKGKGKNGNDYTSATINTVGEGQAFALCGKKISDTTSE